MHDLRRLSARLAVASGVVLGIAEVVRNWGAWQWWPFWLVDFIAAGLLVSGGIAVLKRRPNSAPLLAGAWGFTVGMAYMSFWSHVETISGPSGANIAHGPLTAIIGVMLVVAVACFVLALLPGGRNAA